MTHLEKIETWLETLPQDIDVFAEILFNEKISEKNRKVAAGVINYVFKSMDLIPDNIDDIGYLDDIFTLRISSLLMDLKELEGNYPDVAQKVADYIKDTEIIREILGDDLFDRLRNFVNTLPSNSARGRNTQQIISRLEVLTNIKTELSAFRNDFKPPPFEKSERVLIKLRSFLDTRLPR